MSDVDTKAKRRNKRWPEALKREIVAATRERGASVSVVARRYNVNANQVFSWRRRFVFRGARGDLIKILWHDGLGLSLYAKRLERGRFVWPYGMERQSSGLPRRLPPPGWCP